MGMLIARNFRIEWDCKEGVIIIYILGIKLRRKKGEIWQESAKKI